jgi:hypothetical protein
MQVLELTHTALSINPAYLLVNNIKFLLKCVKFHHPKRSQGVPGSLNTWVIYMLHPDDARAGILCSGHGCYVVNLSRVLVVPACTKHNFLYEYKYQYKYLPFLPYPLSSLASPSLISLCQVTEY